MISIQYLGHQLRKFEPGLLVPLERLLLRNKASGFAMPLMALVNPPRVGSTLACQILAQSLEVFYITNLQYIFFRSPYIAFRLTKFLFPVYQYKSDFKSKYGYIDGLNSPTEAQEFWHHWFDLDLAERTPEPDPRRLEHIGRVLESIYAQEAKPLLSPCARLVLYMEELKNLFPRTFFIRVRRDPLAIVSSILRGREVIAGGINRWWSVKPAECLQLPKADPYTQVALQVLATEQRIDQYAVSDPTGVLEVDYEELCADPHSFVDAVQCFLEAGGAVVKKRQNSNLPAGFVVSRPDESTERSRRIRAGLQDAMAILERMSERHFVSHSLQTF